MIEILTSIENKEMVKDNNIYARHREIFKRIGMYFGKSVMINYCNSDIVEYTDSDQIIVNLWSSPVNVNMDMPEVDIAFGKKFCTDGVYESLEDYKSYGDLIPLIEYDDGNFYFLYDVCEFNTEEEFELLELLINGILIQLEGSIELVEKKISDLQLIENEKQRKAFIKKLTKKEEDMKKSRIRDLSESKRSLEDLRKRVRALALNIDVNEKLVESNGYAIEEFEKKIDKEFEIMRTNKKVQDIYIDLEGNIVIDTKQMYSNVICHDKVTRRFRFGEYRITINITNSEVTFINRNEKDKRKSAWDSKCNHPHVRPDGSACLGSASSLIVDCVDRYQWGVLTDVVINFLESVNTEDSAGAYYYNWDTVDSEGNKLAEQYKRS